MVRGFLEVHVRPPLAFGIERPALERPPGKGSVLAAKAVETHKATAVS